MALLIGQGSLEEGHPTPEQVLGKKDPKKDKKVVLGSDLTTIIKGLRKDMGDKSVVSGNSIPPVIRQPTGIFELDFYLGGGFPRGRYSIVYGPESSNKTNIALLAIAQAQKRKDVCNKAVFVDIEKTFTPSWAQQLGVDVDNLLVADPAYGEQAVDMIDALIRADDVGIIVVDSIAALISNKEIAKSSEEYDVGTSALLIKRMVNKMMIAFGEERKRGHDPCVILINQRRFKPAVQFGDPEVMPGGEAQRFLASLILRTYGKNLVDTATNTTLFKETNVVVKKSKVPIRAMSFKFDLCVNPTDTLGVGETNSFNMVKSHLQSLGLMEKTAQGYVIAGVEGVWPTQSAIQDSYRANHELTMKLQNLVNNAMTDMILVEEQQQGIANAATGEAFSIGGGA